MFYKYRINFMGNVFTDIKHRFRILVNIFPFYYRDRVFFSFKELR